MHLSVSSCRRVSLCLRGEREYGAPQHCAAAINFTFVGEASTDLTLHRLDKLAERGFDPRTFGFWAQHASHCATPLIIAADAREILAGLGEVEACGVAKPDRYERR